MNKKNLLETSEKSEEFINNLNKIIKQKDEELTNLTQENQNLKLNLNDLESLKIDFEKTKEEKDKFKNKLETIIKSEWSKMPVLNKNLDLETLKLDNLDLKNLQKELIKFADDNQLLKKEEKQENNHLTELVVKPTILTDNKKGVVF